MNFRVLIICGLLLGLGAGPAEAKNSASHRRPYISKDIKGFDRCTADDPVPCPGRRITVKNPTTKHVVVVVECEQDSLLREKTIILPYRSVVFDLGRGDRPLSKGDCYVLGWYPWTGDSLE